jgi:hypothetical protein
MKRRSEISLGDLLSAFGELAPDEETGFAITRLLKLTPFRSLEELKAGGGEQLKPDPDGPGFGERPEGFGASAPRRRRRRTRPPRVPPTTDEGGTNTTAGGSVVEPRALADAGDAPPLPSKLVKVADGEPPLPPRPEEGSFKPAEARPAAAPRPFEPLLIPNWTRALLSAVLARRSDDGPINVKRVVELVAAREPILRLPRLPRPTLAGGVQMLVDRSGPMLLFLEDESWLEAEVQKVAGLGFLSPLYFEGCPTRAAGHGSKSEWKNYLTHHLPKPGTVVLLLTDLGIGRPEGLRARAGAQEWLAFTDAVRKRNCPVVALVPYPPARWPAALRKQMTIIQWDRPTSASLVHARVGKGHDTRGRGAR